MPHVGWFHEQRCTLAMDSTASAQDQDCLRSTHLKGMLVLREVEGVQEIILQVVCDDLILTTGIINQLGANVQGRGSKHALAPYHKSACIFVLVNGEQPDNCCDLLTVSP